MIEDLYMLLNQLVLVGWVLLIFAPRWKVTIMIVRSGLFPALFAVVYFVLAVLYFNPIAVDFSSLSGLMQGFEDPNLVVMGWAHYLVFDLFVALWIISDSERLRIKHFWMIPILILNLMAGPIGFLIYWIVRLFKLRGLHAVTAQSYSDLS
jgi:hypothetical protein